MRLTETSIKRLGPGDHFDDQISGLVLRVYPSGKRSWVFRYRFDGRSRRFTIPKSATLTPAAARRIAKRLAGKVASNIDPQDEKQEKRLQERKAKASTLRAYLEGDYGKFVMSERKSGKESLDLLKGRFDDFLDMSMIEIDEVKIRRWTRMARERGVKAATTNRQIGALRSCLNSAFKDGLIDRHPLAGWKRAKVDKAPPNLRALSKDDETALRKALRKRDKRKRKDRMSANTWRADRGYDAYPEFGKYVDHLEPMVLLALNTGMRRGELFNLRWDDVSEDTITVRGNIAKSGQTRTIPLNPEARQILNDWSSDYDLVFPSANGGPFNNIKSSWTKLRDAAGLPHLRIHDLRHTVATRLVQGGADIETARTILGHADIATTALYLHANDESRRNAMELL